MAPLPLCVVVWLPNLPLTTGSFSGHDPCGMVAFFDCTRSHRHVGAVTLGKEPSKRVHRSKRKGIVSLYSSGRGILFGSLIAAPGSILLFGRVTILPSRPAEARGWRAQCRSRSPKAPGGSTLTDTSTLASWRKPVFGLGRRLSPGLMVLSVVGRGHHIMASDASAIQCETRRFAVGQLQPKRRIHRCVVPGKGQGFRRLAELCRPSVMPARQPRSSETAPA